MVRYKKRYFVVQLDRESDLLSQLDTIRQNTSIQSKEERIRKKHSKAHKFNPNSGFKRALIDPQPLNIPDGLLAATLKDLVGQIHGDFGRAAVTVGLRTIYSNAETRLCLIQSRHGPHRLLASSLPFLTKIRDEKIVPKLIYTGATVRNCYQKMLEYQKHQLNIAMKELGTNSLQPEGMKKSDTGTEDVKKYNTSTKDCVKVLEQKLMNIKSMRPSDF